MSPRKITGIFFARWARILAISILTAALRSRWRAGVFFEELCTLKTQMLRPVSLLRRRTIGFGRVVPMTGTETSTAETKSHWLVSHMTLCQTTLPVSTVAG